MRIDRHNALAAQDALDELSTGKETDRARMRRVMAEQSARKDDE